MKQFFEFDQFQLNVAQRSLTRDGKVVRLKGQQFDLLALLVQAQGATVTDEHVVDELQLDVERQHRAVEVKGLFNRLRSSLSTSAHLIEPVPYRGWRLAAAVAEVRTLGAYRIEREIGRGAFGRVYLARDPMLDRRVALKTVELPDPEDAESRARFLREARAAAGLVHPGIVTIYEFGESDSLLYIAMEYVEGQSLDLYCKPDNLLPATQACALVISAADALYHAHRHKVVHRDIKPSNLMRVGGTDIKVMDFGLAKPEATELTHAGRVYGTPSYMSPEQALGNLVDGRSDLFSLAIVLFELLTGYKPFPGDSIPQILFHITRQEPVYPPNWEERVSAALARFLGRALAKRPSERFSSAEQFASELRAVLPRLPGSSRGEAPGAVAPPSAAPAADVIDEVAAEVADEAASPDAPAAGDDRTLVLDLPVDPPSAPPVGENARAEPDVGSQTTFVPIGDVRSAAPQDVALLVEQSPDTRQVRQRIGVERFPFSIGRSTELDLCIQDPGLSRRHVNLDYREGRFYLNDLGSSNGSFVNGRQLISNQSEPLQVNDTLQIGRTLIRFVADLPVLPSLGGQRFDGRYRLNELLHQSVRAATYAARDQTLPRDVAIKIFSPALRDFAHDLEDFRRQAESAARLRHARIQQVLDFGEGEIEIDGRTRTVPFLCSELLLGGTLASLLEDEPMRPLDQVAGWVRDLAEGLGHAHAEGVVHGGLKPSCILFDRETRPVLSDFSIGRGHSAGVTGASGLFGAPGYLAPEQWEGQPPSEASDRYALAAVAYLMIAGIGPFDGLQDPEVRQRRFERGPVAVHLEANAFGRRDTPAALSDVLARGLHREPDARYPDPIGFADALSQALLPEQPKAKKVFLSYRRSESSGWATLFARELRRRGIEVFQDLVPSEQADRFPDRLGREIDACGVFVCLLGATTLESAWVRHEIELAHGYSKPMIPIFHESFQREALPQQPAAVEAMLEFEAVRFYHDDDHYIDAALSRLTDIIRNTLKRD